MWSRFWFLTLLCVLAYEPEVTKSQNPDGGRMRRGFRPLQTLLCLSRCQSPTSCPTPKEMKREMMRIDDDCRECVMERCGEVSDSDEDSMMDCIMRARENCRQCPAMNREKRMRMRNCRECVQSCRPDREFMPRFGGCRRMQFGQPRRIFKMIYCVKTCQNSSSCPTSYPSDSMMALSGNECRRCREEARRNCRYGESQEDMQIMGCMRQIREECRDSCPTYMRHHEECRECVMNCSAKPDQMRRPKIQLFQTVFCMGNCESPQSCPSKEEMQSRFTNYSAACKQCVNETCGGLNQTKCPGQLQCMRQAVEDCPACPTLTDAEQTRMRTCKSCIRACLPQKGNRRKKRCRRPIPKPFQKLMCVRNCFARERCPNPLGILEKFRNTSVECQTCVYLDCVNSTSSVDCILTKLPDCVDSGCPEQARKLVCQMRSCRRCVGSCLSGDKRRRGNHPKRKMGERKPGRKMRYRKYRRYGRRGCRKSGSKSRRDYRPRRHSSRRNGPKRRGYRKRGYRKPRQCSLAPKDIMASFVEILANPQLRKKKCMCVRKCMMPESNGDGNDDDDNDDDDENDYDNDNDNDMDNDNDNDNDNYNDNDNDNDNDDDDDDNYNDNDGCDYRRNGDGNDNDGDDNDHDDDDDDDNDGDDDNDDYRRNGDKDDEMCDEEKDKNGDGYENDNDDEDDDE